MRKQQTPIESSRVHCELRHRLKARNSINPLPCRHSLGPNCGPKIVVGAGRCRLGVLSTASMLICDTCNARPATLHLQCVGISISTTETFRCCCDASRCRCVALASSRCLASLLHRTLHGFLCTASSARLPLHGFLCTASSARLPLHGFLCTASSARLHLNGFICSLHASTARCTLHLQRVGISATGIRRRCCRRVAVGFASAAGCVARFVSRLYHSLRRRCVAVAKEEKSEHVSTHEILQEAKEETDTESTCFARLKILVERVLYKGRR